MVPVSVPSAASADRMVTSSGWFSGGETGVVSRSAPSGIPIRTSCCCSREDHSSRTPGTQVGSSSTVVPSGLRHTVTQWLNWSAAIASMRSPAIVIAGYDSKPAARSSATRIPALSLQTPPRSRRVIAAGCSV